jgi:Tol biopolymer transport system component
MLIDSIDSFYQYVRQRVQTVNPTRTVAGFLIAQDWPPPNVKLEAFYLISHGENPIGRQGFSPQIPIVSHMLEWQWIVLGQDVVAGQVGPNRGLRFRTHFQMKDELRQALSPYFCQKQTWAAVQNGAQITWTGTPVQPPEWIGWAPPEYREKLDRDSGKVEGSVAVRLWDMTDPILT